MTLNGVMAVTLRYFSEVGKPALQKTMCGGIYARVYCIFSACTMSSPRMFTFAISSPDEFLVLITNTKSHTGFRLLPTSMTLYDFERRNSPYFCVFSSNLIALQADYVTVVEDRPIMSILSPCSSTLPLSTKTNAPCNAVSLR